MRSFCAITGLVVIGLMACVEASVRAGPYQIMYLWNAYCIEVETYGHGNTWTAQNCNQGKANPCDFDEFIKHIEMARNKPGWTGSTGVGTAKDLDVIQTAENLKTLGYSSTIDPAKLSPSSFTKQDQPTLGRLLQDSFDAIQQAKTDILKVSGKSYANIADFVYNAGESLDVCIDMRRADQADALIKDYKAGMATYGFTDKDVAYKSPKPTLPNGGDFDEIDVEATIKKNPNLTEAWKKFIRDYVSNYDQLAGAPLKHTTAIIDLQKIRDGIWGSFSCF
ncbi:hypothetical protein JX265_003103 [Neoarthrinium moseri]|uniref:Uncharacterized protein n=1 Tax=Neoarthrinium moseri TaxID=1658444 RepID=A0A9P9WU56_9PEZI|nr:uncharacterized protein JN550_011280 [Neoarthrinium moseri]KAI1852621.1 hypothetical protein JX266_002162 [Neoarthrinium moseri]KAI1860818.1 hypothetical protein JN550_011280 [Neoarthrinium moseri]KAI1878926.1 hypothetical protein JX265_003103 [Neoarthrinium moseri]